MEFSIKGPDPATRPPQWKKNMVQKCFESIKMNLKVNLFFHLHETPFTPFGFPTLIVSRLSGGVG